jgi:1,4-dihydroxy-6-naphthoate synthase
LPLHIQKTVNRLIQQSIELGWQQYPLLSNYVKQHAQEMSEEVMKKHIALYVNDFSIDLGELGEKAIHLMFNKAKELNLFQWEETQLIIH